VPRAWLTNISKRFGSSIFRYIIPMRVSSKNYRWMIPLFQIPSYEYVTTHESFCTWVLSILHGYSYEE
jgi:hypothetical protein